MDKFIHVKFDNKAGKVVKISTHKGKMRDYLIQPRMSLELSFVEKAAFTMVPVLFHVSDLQGHPLLVNGDAETYRVTPSESKERLVNATITSPCEYSVPLLSVPPTPRLRPPLHIVLLPLLTFTSRSFPAFLFLLSSRPLLLLFVFMLALFKIYFFQE